MAKYELEMQSDFKISRGNSGPASRLNIIFVHTSGL